MQRPFATLAPEYAALLAAMRLDPAREHELAARAAVVLALSERHRDEWAEVAGKTGVPRLWGLASFERESGSDYSRSPAQGDRWDRVSVNVPRGLGPYRCWAMPALRRTGWTGLMQLLGARASRPPPPSPPPQAGEGKREKMRAGRPRSQGGLGPAHATRASSSTGSGRAPTAATPAICGAGPTSIRAANTSPTASGIRTRRTSSAAWCR